MKIKLTGYELDESTILQKNLQSNEEQAVRKVIELSAVRGGKSGTIEETIRPDELVEFQFENGLVWVSEPAGIPTFLGKNGKKRSGNEEEAIFTIPNKIQVSQGNKRGLFDYLALKLIRIFAPKLTEPVGILVPLIEQRKLPFEGLNFLTDDFTLLPFKDTSKLALDQPILLFIHGTFSNTISSFGGLVNFDEKRNIQAHPSTTWKELRKAYQNNILAFDHKTLSKSPFENALELLEALPAKAQLHLVAQSRGGLVGEVLVRCSHRESAFSDQEIEILEKLNTSALSKFLETLKALSPVVSSKLFEQTGLKKFVVDQAVNWQAINLKTVAQLIVKLNQLDWKSIDFKGLLQEGKEALLAELFVQLDTPNRQKEADLLRALNQVAAEKEVVVKKMVRVACPADGTSLLGERIDTILNVLLNIFRFAAGPAYLPLTETLSSLLNSVIKQRNNPRVFPGLEIMVKGSPLLALLNNPAIEVESDLNIIAGKTGGFDGPLQVLANFVADRYFPSDNDLVVDTDSMFEGVARFNDVYYKFVEGGGVSHGTYFSNETTQNAIYKALLSNDRTTWDFKKANKEGVNRSINVKLPRLQGGSLYLDEDSQKENAIILIPGIMGSNLSDRGTEIWINYLRMSGGSLSRLAIESKDISATSVLKTAYEKIVDYFSPTHHVVVFPYDWRKSLSKAATDLKTKIEDLRASKKSIQIIAHSMGGLVVRGLMMEKGGVNYWKKLTAIPNFKVLLLGTPWKGSYHIPSVLLGQGTTINSLAKLDLLQNKKELLAIFSKFPGLFELMPIDENKNHRFDDQTFWEELHNITYDNNWVIPTEDTLTAFKAYREKVRRFYKNKLINSSDFSDYVYYIAGKEDITFETFNLEDQYRQPYANITEAEKAITDSLESPFGIKRMSVVFQGTPAGDGSVTWESGIPESLKNKAYYATKTIHGELANDTKIFAALQEILENGSTEKLTQIQPTTGKRSIGFSTRNAAPLPNDKEGLIRGIIGLRTQPSYRSDTQRKNTLLEVSVKNGHLKYAKHPVIIGHFKDDIITSAENVMDDLLDRALSERVELGVYPGDINSNLIMLPSQENAMGTVIVGLGDPESFNPFKLQETIESGCLTYILDYDHHHFKNPKGGIGISTLMIGTNYINISTSAALNAILSGIVQANRKITLLNVNQKDKALAKKYPIITDLEFIEIYEDKAISAFHHLYNIEEGNNSYNIQLKKKIIPTSGRRTYLPVAEDTSWWKRLTAQVRTTPNSDRKSLYFNTSSQQARIVERDLYANERIIAKLLEENSQYTNWNKRLMKTVFNLIVPNDFKMIFRSQQNLLLLLDKNTAWYPWELLHYDENAQKPICVTSGMIRQLATSNDRRVVRPVRGNTALIIGDPYLGPQSPFPQLPAAKKEGEQVDKILQNAGYNTTALINENLTAILSSLFNDYKIVHIACHGEVEFKFDKNDPNEQPQTGLVLSGDIILTSAEVDKMDSTPELVFINSCFAGSINAQKEAKSRARYSLAANIGTQFIENGAKAVIVAGWAIDDEAALRFAEVFYKEMLSGQTFSSAITQARKTCFTEFPNTNTWGAYQCYGDQYYRFNKKIKTSGTQIKFRDRKQILATLEDFINSAKSSRKRGDDLFPYLQKISKGIAEVPSLSSATILALEAEAYAEIEENDIALEKYHNLLTQAKADFTVRAWEQMLNLRARHYVNLFRSKKLKDGINKMDEIIADIQYLNSKGITSERYSILASAYRRKSLILIDENEKEAKEKAIFKMAKNYKAAYALKINQGEGNTTYSLANWLISEKFVTKKMVSDYQNEIDLPPNEMTFKDLVKTNKTDEKGVFRFLENELKEIANATKSEFWDIIANVNIYQAQILYCETAQITEVGKKISDAYQKAWDMDGSFKQKSSEIAQMEFVLEGAKSLLETTQSERYQILEKECARLVTFFKELD